jgi:hypothetical protein
MAEIVEMIIADGKPQMLSQHKLSIAVSLQP